MRDLDIISKSDPDHNTVLAKALIVVAKELDLQQHDLTKIIGKSDSTWSRIFKDPTLDVNSKEGELALLLIRAYRSLASMVGGDPKKCCEWFKSNNHYLNGKPIEIATSIQGLVKICNYLDAMRGKI